MFHVWNKSKNFYSVLQFSIKSEFDFKNIEIKHLCGKLTMELRHKKP